MNCYHFSLGNSTEGPIGFCAQVVATTSAEAVAKLQRALRNVSGTMSEVAIGNREQDLEYLNVYFNPTAIELSDADEAKTPVARR